MQIAKIITSNKKVKNWDFIQKYTWLGSDS